MPKYKLTESDKTGIIEKYNNGVTIPHLSGQYLIDRSCIRLVLEHAGTVRRVIKPKSTAPRIRKNMRTSRPAPLRKRFYLWKEFPQEKEYPRSYADYARKKKINLKKYFSSYGLTREECFKNKTGGELF